MPRRREPVEHPERECAAPECSNRFTPKRATAKYCTQTCGRRATRARKAAEAAAEEESKTDTPAEHDLVKAIRAELASADRLGTFKGQLALQLARRMVNPEESSPAALAKELQNVMTAALAPAPGAEPEGNAVAEPEDDEVARARQAREAKATAAAKG